MGYKLSGKVNSLERSATDEIDNVVKEMKRAGITDIISFGGGEPVFDTPEVAVNATIAALRAGKTKYEPTAGDYELREEISKKLKRQNRIDVPPEQVVVTPGGKFALYLAFQAVLEPGDKVVVIEPAWVSYAPMATLAGAEVVHVPTFERDHWQPDMARLRAAMDRHVRFVVVNSPCNPTGAVYPPALIRDIARLAEQYGALVVSDEIYEDMIYTGEHYSPAADFENVITVNGFSKCFAMTGWRLGYVAAPPEIVEGMIKIYQHSATCVNAFAQAGAVEALRSPEARQETLRMTAGYRERGELITRLLNESGLFRAEMPAGAFYSFPAFAFHKSSLEVANLLLQKAHIATVPGSAFGACGEGYLRLSYSTSKEAIVEAFERIHRLAKELNA
jgi:aspartate aminotransferase